MTEIPDDIKRTANLVILAEENGLDPFYSTNLRYAIAKAIMDERERCALVAEKTAFRAQKFAHEQLPKPSLTFQHFRDGANAVADAIRRGDQP